MRELIYDVAIRPRGDGWQALVPALPGVAGEGATDIEAFEQVKPLVMPYLAARIANGEAVARQTRAGEYLGEYGLVFWQFLKIRLGPLRPGQSAVEPIFPDIHELLCHLGDDETTTRGREDATRPGSDHVRE
ncbi:type II toxin-antitoxin system HicB family antitoxin [Salinicola rhizosphaerae]|uniref:Uncharacterized protein n=1 Tax=Salinicola rhizosphaerae TaxID=1443141 RepID=A0ABQ3E7H6_9GAMM|nr:hypothetical protein [Salinicola rhizosphaerae]GHB23673.1 hypothetical protein GCM10009038_23230 [Salinicola rhizosphaerae]